LDVFRFERGSPWPHEVIQYREQCSLLLLVNSGLLGRSIFNLSQAAQHNPEALTLGSPLLMSLLPNRRTATYPQHVKHERLTEKRQVAEDKQFYRLQAGLAGMHPYASTAGLPSPE
jgi:hypothetical protein